MESSGFNNVSFNRSEKTSYSDTDLKTDTFLFVQALLTLIINLALLAFLLKEPKLREKKSNKSFINLLIVHCFLSILTMIAGFYTSSTKRIFKNGILIQMFLCLMINSIDRYINIKYPFKYQSIPTKHVIMVSIISWLVPLTSIVCSACIRMTAYHCTVVCTIMIVVATTFLVITNINIYKIARRHSVAIIKQETVNAKKKPSNSLKHHKASLVCFSIVTSFIVLWFPYFVHNVMIMMNAYVPSDSNSFTLAVVKIAFLNSLFDPILFVVFNKGIKKVIRTKFSRLSRFKQFESTFTTGDSTVHVTTGIENENQSKQC